MIKLSVITVNFNNVNGLVDTLASLAAQRNFDFELHVIDGRSTDGVMRVMDKYSSILTSFTSEQDRGIYHAMNKGIEKSKGRYLYFLNSGDTLDHPDVLYHSFKDGIDADIILGNLVVKNHRIDFNLLGIMNGEVAFPHQASFISREIFSLFGLYDEQWCLAEQNHFYKVLFGKKDLSLHYVPLDICNYDVSSKSFSVQNAERGRKELKEFSNMFLEQRQADLLHQINADIERKKLHNRNRPSRKNVLKIRTRKPSTYV
jgi:glycosyltransferase involved in cell wall biosynthesis